MIDEFELLPDDNSVGAMLREYNMIASRNKMLKEGCNIKGAMERPDACGMQCRDYVEIYNLEEDLCVSLYRLHSLASPRNRENIGIIISEKKRNIKRIKECYASLCADSLTYVPKMELSLNYAKLLYDITLAQRDILVKLTAVDTSNDRLKAIINTEIAISYIFSILMSVCK